jgi:hypothetical protein
MLGDTNEVGVESLNVGYSTQLQHYLAYSKKQFLPIQDSALHLKDSSQNVAVLKQHLIALPNYKLYPEMLYDSATWRAILHFQYRHHLKETGKAAMADEKQQKVVNLPTAQKIPVQLWYQTVWVDEAGMLHFAEDIYEHDEKQLQWLLK